ncbi:hypothetical protein [Aquibacillus saliphilus]|uniref:hypothetical protein n=1 Tax=Aquibacillus saliphilus TaxID=1909422 RepID=UPI001CF07430|nr:hypothetical protein [Aquibacillus saliphilus]
MKKYLSTQVHIYSLDTSAFYNYSEQKLHNKLRKVYRYRDHLKGLKETNPKHRRYANQRIKRIKESLYIEFNINTETRHLNCDHLRENNIISIFDSVLTRTLGIKESELTEDIIVIQTYYFGVLEDLIKNGFIHNGKQYVYFSSSAGQIRTKKSVWIEKSIWDNHKDTLMCGLSVEGINNQGGANVNKYLAYLALTNSASLEMKDFDINKSIVVDDMETNVNSLVDYIDRDTYEITRQTMDIPIEHTDGCGMILPKKSKKAFMVRLPFLKGLLVPFPFDKFAEENNSHIVKDIYGKEWNVQKDDIEIIFTKSQFKMWKHYKDWEDYKSNFIKHNCQAAKLNEEEYIFPDAKLNYQILQTLTDITDDEIKEISEDTIQDILTVGSDKDTMLRILGATESNRHKNSFQEALHIYPELLNDIHAKEVIKNKKKSMVKDAKSGKLNVDGKYTFICPDLYAVCEYLFLGDENPKGLLTDTNVYCDLFEEGKVDCLRSPHLYREHAVRNNTLDENMKDWFITNGLYTSIHDPISKMLQFDVDGDKSLVISNPTIVEVAERNMYNVVPIYYEMAVAPKQEINGDNIYNSLILAFRANIGEISNNITKIWNSDDINLDVIKWLCMENNFVIDYAKTLYMPKRPKHVNEMISKHIKKKVPNFFRYAKDKEKRNVEKINNSVVNRLENIIPNKRINFKSVAGDFDYLNLVHQSNVQINEDIINKYTYLDRRKKWLMNSKNELNRSDSLHIYKFIHDELVHFYGDAGYITDVLTKHLYRDRNSKNKTTLWESFGDELLLNLKDSIRDTIQCMGCGERIQYQRNKRYCNSCLTMRERRRVKEYREKK